MELAKAYPDNIIIDPEYMKKCEGFDYRADTGPGKEMRDRMWEEIKN